MRKWFDFGNGSAARVFGIDVYGSRSKTRWHRLLVRPAYRLGNIVSGFVWKLRYRFDPRHRYNMIDTKLPPRYYDIDVLMLHGAFSLLERYVEDENGGIEELEAFTAGLKASPDEYAPEATAMQVRSESEAANLYRWWKDARPELIARKRAAADSAFRKRDRMRFTEIRDGASRMTFDPATPEEEKAELEYRELKERLAREEQEMLHRLVDIRRSLWT